MSSFVTVKGDTPSCKLPAIAPAASSLQVTRNELYPCSSMLPLPVVCPLMYIGALEPSEALTRSGTASTTVFCVTGTMPSRGSGSPSASSISGARRAGTVVLSRVFSFVMALAMTLSGIANVVENEQNPPPASTEPSVVWPSPTPIVVSSVIRPLKIVIPKS